MNLWAWGANNCGQLGLGDQEDRIVPTGHLLASIVDIKDTVSLAGGGGGYSFLVSDGGELFLTGNNDKGQLGPIGQAARCVLSFQPAVFRNPLSNVKVRQVAAGWDFVIILTAEGRLISWGSNTFGQLGRPVAGGAAKDPYPGEVLVGGGSNKQVDVAAGLRHALSLDESGHVYAWGNGKKCQLGASDDSGKPLLKSFVPVKVTFPDATPVEKVVAGMYFSGALSKGGVFLWGCNKFGQCGLDPESTPVIQQPTKLKSFDNLMTSSSTKCAHEGVTSLSVGWTHLVARNAVGQLFSWGRADLGQLGRACEKPRDHIPGLVEGLEEGVTQHVCSSEHTLALTATGRLFAWGWNEHGICGTGDEENVREPTEVRSVRDKTQRILSVGCGAGHCFYLSLEIS